MDNYLITLTQYNHWAAQKTIAFLEKTTLEQWGKDLGGSFKSLADTVLHLVSAEKLTCERLQDNQQPFLANSFVGSKAEILALWGTYSQKLAEIVAAFGGESSDTLLQFKTLKGADMQMERCKLITHVVNHSTYHRGQLVNYLRQLGFTGLESTDMFNFYLIETRAKKQ